MANQSKNVSQNITRCCTNVYANNVDVVRSPNLPVLTVFIMHFVCFVPGLWLAFHCEVQCSQLQDSRVGCMWNCWIYIIIQFEIGADQISS